MGVRVTPVRRPQQEGARVPGQEDWNSQSGRRREGDGLGTCEHQAAARRGLSHTSTLERSPWETSPHL